MNILKEYIEWQIEFNSNILTSPHCNFDRVVGILDAYRNVLKKIEEIEENKQ